MSATTKKTDRAGRRYSPATRAGGSSPTKGRVYSIDPPTTREVKKVARQATDDDSGWRARALIGLLASGLTVSEALSVSESAVDGLTGTLIVTGKHAREAKVDNWALDQILGWLPHRYNFPAGPMLCVIRGTTVGQSWSPASARIELHNLATSAGVSRRFAPQQLRYYCAVSWLRNGKSLADVCDQLGLSSSSGGRNHRTIAMLKTLVENGRNGNSVGG